MGHFQNPRHPCTKALDGKDSPTNQKGYDKGGCRGRCNWNRFALGTVTVFTMKSVECYYISLMTKGKRIQTVHREVL